MAWQGSFKPKCPEKYAGDPTKIVFRSRIELRYMQWLDTHPDVISWASEEVVVPYYDSVKDKQRRYFPDLLVKFKTGKVVMVELKHSSDLKEPQPPKRKTPRYLSECRTWVNNQEKWAAAKVYCSKRGWEFKVMSEKELGKAY